MKTVNPYSTRGARLALLASRLPFSQLQYPGFQSHLLAVLCLAAVVAGLACGKRRPPLPPVERVQQRTELLSGAQQGNQVILSWPAPRRNAPDSSVQSIRRIDVYRLAEKPGAPLPLTEEEFAARSTLIGSVTYDQIKTAGETLSYLQLPADRAGSTNCVAPNPDTNRKRIDGGSDNYFLAGTCFQY